VAVRSRSVRALQSLRAAIWPLAPSPRKATVIGAPQADFDPEPDLRSTTAVRSSATFRSSLARPTQFELSSRSLEDKRCTLL
jgi:hypothetical protein